jgi:hypothetical protein
MAIPHIHILLHIHENHQEWQKWYSHVPVTADSVFAVTVIHDLPRYEKKKLNIKEINVS